MSPEEVPPDVLRCAEGASKDLGTGPWLPGPLPQLLSGPESSSVSGLPYTVLPDELPEVVARDGARGTVEAEAGATAGRDGPPAPPMWLGASGVFTGGPFSGTTQAVWPRTLRLCCTEVGVRSTRPACDGVPKAALAAPGVPTAAWRRVLLKGFSGVVPFAACFTTIEGDHGFLAWLLAVTLVVLAIRALADPGRPAASMAYACLFSSPVRVTTFLSRMGLPGLPG